MELTRENYQKGFLVDDEWMAGISDADGRFAAFITSHLTGEYVAHQEFGDLDSALGYFQALERPWVFESTSGCGEGGCGQGACGTESCPGVCDHASS